MAEVATTVPEKMESSEAPSASEPVKKPEGKPAEKTMPEDSAAAAVEAVNMLAQGKRNMLVGEIPQACNQLQEACRLLAKKYGETGDECAEAYLTYGKALLELSRMESGVLGNALQGIGDEDEEDKTSQSSDDKTEESDKMTEEDKEKLSTDIIDAMVEREGEGKVLNGKKEEKQDATKTDEKKTEDTKNEDAKTKTDDAKAEDSKTEEAKKETKTEDTKTKTDDTKAEDSKTEEAKKETKSEDAKTEDSKPEGAKTKEAKVNDKEAKEEAMETEETKVEAKDKKETENKEKKEADSDEKKEDESEEKETEDEAAESEDIGEEEGEGTEGEGTEGTEGEASAEEGKEGEAKKEDEEEVSNLQLSWEMLELAKKIFTRSEAKEMKLKLAEAHLKLGEVGLETEQYEQAIEDLKSCLTIQKETLEPEDRCIAETYYQLGLACTYNAEYDNAITNYKGAADAIKAKIAKLTKVVEDAEASSKGKEAASFDDPVVMAQKEVKELQDILPDIMGKMEDVEDERKSSDKVKQMLKENMASELGSAMSAFATAADSSKTEGAAKPVSDITHLVRKKRKPEDEAEDTSKKAKVENGSGDSSTNGAAVNGNGTTSPEKTQEIKPKTVEDVKMQTEAAEAKS